MRLLLLAVTPLFAFAQDNSASLIGHLADQAGVPIWAPIRLDSPTAGVHKEGWSNKDGEFHFLELPAGVYLFQASSPGFKRFTTMIHIAAGEEKTLPGVELKVGTAGACGPPAPVQADFPLEGQLGALSGNIQRGSSPVANAQLSLIFDGTGSQSAAGKTDSRGNFSFPQLSPGLYSLRIGSGTEMVGLMRVAGGFDSWYLFELTNSPQQEPYVCE